MSDELLPLGSKREAGEEVHRLDVKRVFIDPLESYLEIVPVLETTKVQGSFQDLCAFFKRSDVVVVFGKLLRSVLECEPNVASFSSAFIIQAYPDLCFSRFSSDLFSDELKTLSSDMLKLWADIGHGRKNEEWLKTFNLIYNDFIAKFSEWKNAENPILKTRVFFALDNLYAAEKLIMPDDVQTRMEFDDMVHNLRIKCAQIFGEDALQAYDEQRQDIA